MIQGASIISCGKMEITHSKETENPSKVVIHRDSGYHISRTMNCKIKTAKSACKEQIYTVFVFVRVCVCVYMCIIQRTTVQKKRVCLIRQRE